MLRSSRQDPTIHEGESLMAISLYSGFVPVCLQLLGGLKTVLQKAEEHANAQKWDTATVLNLRLYPDMFTLERQVRQVWRCPELSSNLGWRSDASMLSGLFSISNLVFV